MLHIHAHWHHRKLMSHMSHIRDNEVVGHSSSKGGRRRFDLVVRESHLHCLRLQRGCLIGLRTRGSRTAPTGSQKQQERYQKQPQNEPVFHHVSPYECSKRRTSRGRQSLRRLLKCARINLVYVHVRAISRVCPDNATLYYCPGTSRATSQYLLVRSHDRLTKRPLRKQVVITW